MSRSTGRAARQLRAASPRLRVPLALSLSNGPSFALQHFVYLLLIVAELTTLLVHRPGLGSFVCAQLLLRLFGASEAKQRATERIPRLEQFGVERHGASQHHDGLFVTARSGFNLTKHAERVRVCGIDQRRGEI